MWYGLPCVSCLVGTFIIIRKFFPKQFARCPFLHMGWLGEPWHQNITPSTLRKPVVGCANPYNSWFYIQVIEFYCSYLYIYFEALFVWLNITVLLQVNSRVRCLRDSSSFFFTAAEECPSDNLQWQDLARSCKIFFVFFLSKDIVCMHTLPCTCVFMYKWILANT